MGKKAKKKMRVPPPKEKKVSSLAQKNPNLENDPSGETVDFVVSAVTEKKPCQHSQKGCNLGVLSAKLGSTESIRCEDCREGGRGNSGRGKHGKKNKGSSSTDSKSKSKATWICLECGHYGCGGVGFPTIPQSHAVRHAKLTRHPLSIQFERPSLRWCSPCSALVRLEDNTAEAKDVYVGVVKLIKGRLTKVSEGDVEDHCFVGGSVMSEVVTVRAKNSLSGCSEESVGYYVVRGLVNLGNTCFFNSVMQNLLSMDRLKDSILKLNTPFGPLTVSLKKLFCEVKGEEGKKNVINPKSLFGSLCSKAPQFRGYQQHDSHEVLRCLLDILSTEEIDVRKKMNEREDGVLPSNQFVTLVDSIFGGQISSSVCCVECGHTSTTYEPFLDLSVPVPTKKPHPRKSLVSRANKAKVQTRKGNRSRGKDPHISRTVSAGAEASPEVQPSKPISESTASSSHSRPSDSSTEVATERDPVLSDCVTKEDVENTLCTENAVEQYSPLLAEFTWLDYLDSEPAVSGDVARDCNSVQVEDNSTWMDYICPETTSNNKYVPSPADDGPSEEDAALENCLKPRSKTRVVDNLNQDTSSSRNSCNEETLLVQDSEVVLLHYKEDAQVSSNSVNDSLDFVGFGDLFMEPDMDPVPPTRVGPEIEVAESSFMAGNSSESDPGEVDNSVSPVSVESCLAHFTKPELLSNDNAWHCEKCSKTLHLQNKKRKQVETPEVELSGSGNTSVVKVGNLSNNGYAENDSSFDKENVVALSTGEINGSCTKYEKSELNGCVTAEVQVPETSDTLSCNDSHCQASFSDRTTEPCGTDELISSSTSCLPKAPLEVTDDDGDTDMPTVKVKRNATKRTLISRAPPIMTIHLKRFSQDSRGRLSKLSGHVAFRETLDISPYMVSRCG